MKTRKERGLELFNKLHDQHAGEALVNSVKDICPDFADITMEFAFGDIFSRPGLAIKTRELIVIGMCTAMGDMGEQLKAHIEAALVCGATKTEITETILQSGLYGGFARVTNAMIIAKEVLRA